MMKENIKPVLCSQDGDVELINKETFKEQKGQSIQMEVSQTNKLHRQLARQIEFEKLLARIATCFVNISSERLVEEFHISQRLICQCLEIDRSSIYLMDDCDNKLVLRHLYTQMKIPQVEDSFVGEKYFPWCEKKLKKGEVIKVMSMETLPQEAPLTNSLLNFME